MKKNITNLKIMNTRYQEEIKNLSRQFLRLQSLSN